MYVYVYIYIYTHVTRKHKQSIHRKYIIIKQVLASSLVSRGADSCREQEEEEPLPKAPPPFNPADQATGRCIQRARASNLPLSLSVYMYMQYVQRTFLCLFTDQYGGNHQ